MNLPAASWRSSPALAQLVRFGVVGLFATAVYVLATRLLHQYAGLSVPTAASLSFVLVVAMNYVLHRSWTFRSSRRHSSAVPRFLATSVGGMAINHVVVTFGTQWSLPQTAVLLSGVAIVVAWNYLLTRFWVFVDQRRGD